jgi:hypothetical protein
MLLVCRAVDLAEQFHELQQKAATASSVHQVACVDTFTALSSSLQQLLAKQQRLWQQQQQQQQPEQRNTPSRALPAAGAQATSPLWCSVTTNALFDSTPASASAAALPWSPPRAKAAAGSDRLSPLRGQGEPAAAAAAGPSSTEDYWGLAVDHQPLRASLSAVRASQQHTLALSPASLQTGHTQQQQQCAASQLLRQLQEKMQQWFVAYVDGHLCTAQAAVSTRDDCVELLKALTHAQQWMQQQQQQQQGSIAAASTGSEQLLVPATSEPAEATPRSLQQARPVGRRSGSSMNISGAAGGVAAAAGHITPPPAAAAGSLSPAALQHSMSPGSQLQQLQVSLRKSLCHLGFLRFQLPS